MALSISKPLPGLPDVPDLQQLTTDGNTTLVTLLFTALSEAENDGHLEAAALWATPILNAIKSFGEYVEGRHAWEGLRTVRKVLVKEREKEKEVEKRKEREKDKMSGKGSKGKSSGTKDKEEMEMLETYPKPNAHVESNDAKLAQIYELSSTPLTPVPLPSSHPKHLFLTASDLEYNESRHDDRCIFIPEAYAFPHYTRPESNTQKGDGGVVLFGLETWHRMCATSLNLNLLTTV